MKRIQTAWNEKSIDNEIKCNFYIAFSPSSFYYYYERTNPTNRHGTLFFLAAPTAKKQG